MKGPAGAFVLVSLQALAGTFALMWLTMLGWKVVGRGHYRAAAWVLFPLTLAVASLLPTSLRPFGWIVGILQGIFLASVYSQRPLVEALTGGAGAVAGLMLLVRAGAAACGGCWEGVAHGLIGGYMLGAVTHGMVLGHWYLNQPRLPIEPLKGAAGIMLASIGVSLAAGLATRRTLVAGTLPGGVLAFPASGYWWAWLLLVAATGGLGIMVRATVTERATQSATGLLYVQMVTALGAQFLLAVLLAS